MRPDAKRLGAAILALILGAVGVVTLVRYVQTAEDRALAGQQLVDVMVVTQPIAAGTAVDDLDLAVEQRRIPAASRTPGAVTDLSSLDGLATSVDLVPGEQLLAARFEDGSIRRVVGGDMTIPAGLIEVTIQSGPSRAVGGQMQPGEKAAVVVSIDDISPGDGEPDPATGVLLRQALITNIQSAIPESLATEESDRTRQAPPAELLVTVAIEPTDAERLVFASEYGRIWLAREGEGPAVSSGDVIRLETIFDGGLDDALDAASLAATDEETTDEGTGEGKNPDGTAADDGAAEPVEPATEEDDS